MQTKITNALHSDLGLRPSDLRPPTSDLSLPPFTCGRGAGLFLHASSVVVAGGAFLFLGHSTAGKSTIAQLLGKQFPVLADDSVFASRGPDGLWRVVDGSFRFGRDELLGWAEEVRRRAEGVEAVPLRGCLRIHKADEVRTEPLAALELARYLMDAAMEIDLQRKFGRTTTGGTKPDAADMGSIRQMRRRWFGQVAEIARICPGWNLWFSKDSHFTELCMVLSWQVAEARSAPKMGGIGQ